MLCKRPTHKIEESVKEMQGQTFIIEEKLDGERIQLHRRGNEYFYCSRCAVAIDAPRLLIRVKEREGLHLPLWKARRTG